MQIAGAELDDGCTVLGSRVAHVAVEAEAGIAIADAVHVAVPGHLGDHRRGGDRRAASVTVDHGPVVKPASRESEAVHEADGSGDRHPLEASPQRGEVGHVQPAPVDAAHAADRHGNARRGAEDGRIERLALLLGALLRIVELSEGATVPETERPVVDQDCGCDQRSGQRASAGLVGTGDEPGPELAIEAKQASRATPPPGCGALRRCRLGSAASR
jgi:hypothetical protein